MSLRLRARNSATQASFLKKKKKKKIWSLSIKLTTSSFPHKKMIQASFLPHLDQERWTEPANHQTASITLQIIMLQLSELMNTFGWWSTHSLQLTTTENSTLTHDYIIIMCIDVIQSFLRQCSHLHTEFYTDTVHTHPQLPLPLIY